jgi:hypothetical protein
MNPLAFFKGSGTRRHGDDEIRERAAVDNLLRLHDGEIAELRGKFETEQQRAEALEGRFAGAIDRFCPIGRHPRFWVSTPAMSGCPWCLVDYERSQRQMVAPPGVHAAGRVPAAVQAVPLQQRPTGIDVPAPRELPGFRESAVTAAETVADKTLADLAQQGDPDPVLLTGLGRSITVVEEPEPSGPPTVQLPAQRLHGAETTATMPAVETTADHLEPAHVPRPPKPDYPPLLPLADLDLSVTWGVRGEAVDATARMRRVQLAKTG